MTSADYRAWFAKHLAAFPGIKTWLERFPASSDDEDALTRNAITSQWFATLKDLTKAEAILASQTFARRPREERPAYEGHPAEILAIAMENRRKARAGIPHKTVGGKTAVLCKLCGDHGFVDVWHQRTVAAVSILVDPARSDRAQRKAQAYLDRKPNHNAVVACTCDAAIPMWKGHDGDLVYNSKREYQKKWGDTLDDLAEAIRSRAADSISAAFDDEPFEIEEPAAR